MKDYTFGNDKNFILNYEVKDNKIIINYNTYKNVIEYSKEAEEDLLKIMNKQRNNTYYSAFKNNELERNKSDFKFFGKLTVILLLSTIILSFVPVLMTLTLGMTFVTSIITIGSHINICKIKKQIQEVEEDREKNNLFIKNEKLLNESIKLDVVYDNSSISIKRLADNTQQDEDVFNLNKIDKLSLEELKELLENIKIIEEFEIIDEDKRKKLVNNKKQYSIK